jgi:hypothetical protein
MGENVATSVVGLLTDGEYSRRLLLAQYLSNDVSMPGAVKKIDSCIVILDKTVVRFPSMIK